ARIMNMPVRVSLPLDSDRMPPTRNGPEYTCAAGIIRYVLEQERDQYRFIDNSFDPATAISSDSSGNGYGKNIDRGGKRPPKEPFFQSIINLFKELF
ncbi:MAG: hypothetical protein FWE55_03410, partial [Synergistaceae bacterium]|nr:hypothetical protein [Synergistaceae bacterium]